MKIYIIIATIFLLVSCSKDDPILKSADYECTSSLLSIDYSEGRFQDYLDKKVKEGLPGISMLISTEDFIWMGSAGVADIPNDINMEPCNLHMVGSITKTFTASVILQLYDANLLGLDDNIDQYLDQKIIDNLDNAKTATIRQLLNHTSGIPEYLEGIDFALNFFDDPNRVSTDEDDLNLAFQKNAKFSSGTKVAYSNTNYTLLGLIAKKITGKSGKQLYEDYIFNPLVMKNSHFNQDGDIPSNLVRGYFDESGKGGLIDITEWRFAYHSMAGGASSNLEDLYKFMSGSSDFYSNATKQEIISYPNVPFYDSSNFIFGDGEEFKVNKVLGIGLGAFVLDTDYGVAYGHNGGFNGRKARMWYFPDTGYYIIYLINGSGGKIDEIASDIFKNGMIELLFE